MNREPLFRRLIGPAFDHLPAAIRSVHVTEPARFEGHCEVIRGHGMLSRLCGVIAGLPPPGEHVRCAVDIVPVADGETWGRDFGGYPLRSMLRGQDGLLHERMGPASYRFRLVADGECIRWELVGMRVLGIPLPRFARAAIDASESVRDGLYAFDVRATLPVAGLLVHYRGRLTPVAR